MNKLARATQPTQLSLSKPLQTYANEWNNHPHRKVAKLGFRLVVAGAKTPLLLIDIALNIIAGSGKIAVRLFILMPINFAAKVIGKGGVHTDYWSLKKGGWHLFCAALYAQDFFMNPALNLFKPDLYLSEKYVEVYLDINATDKDHTTALNSAVILKNTKQVKRLLALGANPDIANKKGNSPLMIAILLNDAHMVDQLTAAGATVTPFQRKARLLLSSACLDNDCAKLRLLLKGKVDLNTNQNDMTPLSLAISKNSHDVMRLLIEAGHDLNRQDPLVQLTPLGLAIVSNNAEAVQTLLDTGANIHQPEGKNITPFFRLKYETTNSRLDERLKDFATGRKALPYEKQCKTLKLLGHAASLVDTFDLGHGAVSFGGLGGTYLFANQTRKSLATFESAFRAQLQSLSLGLLTDTLTQLQRNLSSAEYAELYRAGKPILIHSGFTNHTAYIVLWKDQLIVCNRHAYNVHPVNKFRYDGEIETLIQQFMDLSAGSSGAHIAFFQQLRTQGVLEKDEFLPSAYSLPLQTGPNCVYANLEYALYLLWQLDARAKRPGDDTVMEEVFSEFQKFRIYQLLRYIERQRVTVPDYRFSVLNNLLLENDLLKTLDLIARLPNEKASKDRMFMLSALAQRVVAQEAHFTRN